MTERLDLWANVQPNSFVALNPINPAFVKHLLLLVADSEGKPSSPRGSQLVHMTLMMHSWVVPSQMFAQKLLTLYPQLVPVLHWSQCPFLLIWSEYKRFFVFPLCLQSRFELYAYIPFVMLGQSLTLSLTYKDCPSDKRELRRTQICHIIRWARTNGDRTGYTALFVGSKRFSVLLYGKAVDQPVPGSIRGKPPPRADHRGPVGSGPIRRRGDALTTHWHLLPVSHV